MRFLKTNLPSFFLTFLLIISWRISIVAGQTVESSEFSEVVVPVKPSLIAHLHLSGTLTESSAADSLSLTGGQITTLRSLVNLIERAGNDEEVKAIIFTYDSFSYELGQMEELRNSINKFKATGKKVYVHTEETDNFDYALLCTADHLSMAPQSSLWLTGIYSESVFVKDLLDMIGIEADFMQMGDFKSAAEMLTKTEPSKDAEENLNWLLDSLYDSLVNMIAQSRGKTADEVKELIDNGPYLADEALEKGLIDAVETRQEFVEGIVNSFDGAVVVSNRYGQQQKAQIDLSSPFALFTLLGEMLSPPQKERKDTIALIHIEGTITSGYNKPSLLGLTGAAFSGDIRKAFEVAAEDDYIKAIVMRVNSPGGSAEASEVILNATSLVKGKKPIIVSMGNLAASGGYYISCKADKIFADEVTQTASIGVVGGKLATTKLWDMIGVNWVGYKRGKNADLLNIIHPFEQSHREFLEGYMQKVYDVFKGHVVQGRQGKLTKPIDEIAGGRVYTGKQAKELGLIDEIGGLRQAIEYAASEVSLEDYEIRVIPKPKDFITMLLEDITGQGARPTDISISSVTDVFESNPTIQFILELLNQVEPKRAKAIYQALQRVELLQNENVIMMMPYDSIYY